MILVLEEADVELARRPIANKLAVGRLDVFWDAPGWWALNRQWWRENVEPSDPGHVYWLLPAAKEGPCLVLRFTSVLDVWA